MPVNLSHEDHELRKLDVATEQQVSVGSYQLTCLQSHLHCPGPETRKGSGTCTLLKGLSPLLIRDTIACSVVSLGNSEPQNGFLPN